MKQYKEVVEYLYQELPVFQDKGVEALEYKLDNILSFCEILGNPHEKLPIIHVAGTNGKGSVSHMLSSILQEAGFKTGLYTSPHLKQFTERIRVNGKQISEESVINFVNTNIDTTKKLKPSFFEWTVAMAFKEFEVQKVDIAVVEVGLGGRLDSTNIITPILSVITNISKDHTEILGNTLEEIAREKAGIIKKNVPLVVGERREETEQIFRQVASKLSAPLFFASEYNVNNYEIDLEGVYQVTNSKTVLKCIEVLNLMLDYQISDQQIANGLKKVVDNTGLKGRWQSLSHNPLVVCDTAHNESGVKEVVKQIKKTDYNNLYVVWGMVKDKNVDDILSLLPKKAKYFFCEPNNTRKLNASDLLNSAKNCGLKGKVIPDVTMALAEAKSKAKEDDMIYVGGSTFVLAEIEDL